MTDDPNSTLRKGLAAAYRNQSPYRERYSHLANILEDEPDAPKYNKADQHIPEFLVMSIQDKALAIFKAQPCALSPRALGQSAQQNHIAGIIQAVRPIGNNPHSI